MKKPEATLARQGKKNPPRDYMKKHGEEQESKGNPSLSG